MRVLFGTICLLIAASPALAANVSVPAPIIGSGMAAAAIGGVLLASRLFKRK